MKWARSRLLDGGSVALAHFYMRDLWTAGERLREAEPEKDMRVTSGVYWLYIYRVIVIDGVRCADPSAPEGRRTQFLTQYRPVFLYLRSKPEGVRAMALEQSGDLERLSSAKRGNDHWLCRGGLEEMTAALEQSGLGNKTVGELEQILPKKNSSPLGGQNPGQSFELPAAKAYVPKFLSPEVYAPKQAEMREKVETGLPEFFK